MADGYHLWSDQIDAQPGNMMQLQEQIARSIADALEIKLRRADALATRGTTHPDAHDNYLLGLSKFSQRGPAPLREALQYFERAVAADSNYAQAWGGIALINAVLPAWQSVDPAVAAQRARQAAERATALDPTIGEPYAALCQSLALSEWRWAEAEKACDAAIARSPNLAAAHQWRGELLNILGRFEESRAAYEQSLERDPRSVIGQVMAAFGAYARADTAGVINGLAAARAVDRTGIARFLGMPLLLGVGDTVSVRTLLTEMSAPADHIELLTRHLRDRAAREAVLQLLDPPPGQGFMARANNRALIGDLEGALDYLEKDLAAHEFNLPHALRNPEYAPLHGDPRFRRIVERMRLTPYYFVSR